MPIIVNENQFQLNTKNTSYVMMVERGYFLHLYWGKKLNNGDHSYMSKLDLLGADVNIVEDVQSGFTLGEVCLEYPAFGRTDARDCAVEIINADGSNIIDLRYKGYEILNGKPEIVGLPSTYNCDETIVITLFDEISNIEVKLFYSVFYDQDVITRHAEITNRSNVDVTIKRALSLCVDFDTKDFDVITNYGAWATERFVDRQPLNHNCVSISSRHGFTSHLHNPYLIVTSKHCNEQIGDAYGALLAYSGEFRAQIEVGKRDTARLLMGINPDNFSWNLKPDKTFYTPEAIITYSAEGLSKMSQNFHNVLRENMCKSKYKNTRRPILLNSWEACYFNFDDKKLVEIAKKSAELGIELFVIDDGWFGKRNDDRTSLGDWFVNTDKIKGGLENVYAQIKPYGIKLGIWFEPEMISEQSELYEMHPDWCLHIQNRPRTTQRNQLLLDLSRDDVCEHVYESVARMLRTGMISYVKWDFNRFMTEVGSALLDAKHQCELRHRYVLGLYKILNRITTDFPDVLFEGCAAGGGRFDAAILQFMPQIWASDDTDAQIRLKSQYGTSLVYPLSSISAHISDSPNHQTHRETLFKTRAVAAYTGSFGYELDPTKLTAEDEKMFRETLNFYKQNGDLFVNGDYYRLINPFEEQNSAWCYVSKDKSTVFAAYVNIEPNLRFIKRRLILQGLDENAMYKDENSNTVYSGMQLMNYGLNITASSERDSDMWLLRRV